MGQTITGLRPATGHTRADGHIFAAETTLETVTCATCGMLYAIPAGLKSSAQAYRGDRRNGWKLCCPIGHTWWYCGETELQMTQRRLEAERDRRARIAAERDQAKAHLRGERAAKTRALNEKRRLKARVAAGVCPCCHRTFQQLARHMAGQHPDYTPEQEAP